MLFSWEELISTSNGRWSVAPSKSSQFDGITAISTDSRSIADGALFLALEGERYDGHNFVIAAAENATAVCVSKITTKQLAYLTDQEIPCLMVADTLAAYQALAQYHRSRLSDIPVVAVTGSSGKTSTKEIIGAIFREAFGENVLISLGNTNNQIGVPSNLLRLRKNHQAAVLEIGTNSPGEVARLAAIIKPNRAVLTNVGPVHLEGLGSVEGVLKEKASIFAHLAVQDGVAIVPESLQEESIIRQHLSGIDAVSFGMATSADVAVSDLSIGAGGDTFTLRDCRKNRELQVDWNLTGEHMATNAAAAYAVAATLDINEEIIGRGLTKCRLPGMRMQVIDQDGTRWINDAYNANPDSMRSFINWLAAAYPAGGGNHYFIVGDMLELGPEESRYHDDILAHAAVTLNGYTIVPVGVRMQQAAGRFKLPAFESAREAREWLRNSVQKNDLLALKGSRGVGLEQVIFEVGTAEPQGAG